MRKSDLRCRCAERMKKMTIDRKAKLKKAVIAGLLILLAVLVVALTIAVYPIAQELQNAQGEELRALLEPFREMLAGFGFLTYPVMVLLQILQMLLAIIPGGPFAIVMGFLFGTAGGTIIGTIGNLLGTALIVWCVNRFGIKFVNKFVNSKGFEKLKFLHDPVKRDGLLFLLFLIPGTPKDLITFFAPFTKAKPSTIVMTATLGRLPALILSVSMGANLSEGDLTSTVVLFAVTAVLGIVGILVRDKVMKNREEKKSPDAEIGQA